MSDPERRHDMEIRDRVARMEPVLATATEEIGRIRLRFHEIAQSQQMLVSASEEECDARREMAKKIDTLNVKVETGILASARAEVQLAATMALHIEQCKTDKAEAKSLIVQLGADRTRMHAENQEKITELGETVHKTLWSAVKWVGGIGGALIVGLIGLLGYLLINGAPWQHH